MSNITCAEKNYLSRMEAAALLTSMGLPTARTTLAKYATTGGGPEYQKYGNRVVYTREAILDFAEKKLSAPRRSSSDPAEQEAA